MSALITALITLFPMQAIEAPAQVDAQVDPVILPAQQRGQTPRTRRAPAKKTPRGQPVPQKKRWLEVFWNIFPPPGNYTMEVGAAVGASFLETAYGGTNPNIMFRGHFGYRPNPRQNSLVAYGALDYMNYKQEAGELSYTSHYTGLMAGGGLLHYYGPLRLDATAEAGALVRVASQSDGTNTYRAFHLQPAVGAIVGGGLSLGGRVTLSLKAGARVYGYPVRTDFSVLYGLEWLIDARPIDMY